MFLDFDNNQIEKKLTQRSFLSSSAFFFTADGIIVDLKTQTPLLSFNKIVKLLKGTIYNAHLTDNILFIRGELQEKDNLLQYGLTIQPVKPLLAKSSLTLQRQLIKAHHWFQWDLQSRFCGKCANLLTSQFDKPEKHCSQCNTHIFPRFSPAVLILIQKRDKILLARSPHFTPGVYSVIAGFVDIGETTEMTIHREVTEELGIKVSKLEYFGSQSWPFPDNLMIAFKTTYKSGQIVINTDELEDAQWFDLDNLPKLPSKASLSRKLIESVALKK